MAGVVHLLKRLAEVDAVAVQIRQLVRQLVIAHLKSHLGGLKLVDLRGQVFALPLQL